MKDTKMTDDKTSQLHPAVVIAFRVAPELQQWADQTAAAEGISRSDIARRALLRERQRQQSKEGVTA
jgi:hypothetical protein